MKSVISEFLSFFHHFRLLSAEQSARSSHPICPSSNLSFQTFQFRSFFVKQQSGGLPSWCSTACCCVHRGIRREVNRTSSHRSRTCKVSEAWRNKCVVVVPPSSPPDLRPSTGRMTVCEAAEGPWRLTHPASNLFDIISAFRFEQIGSNSTG